MRPVPVIVCGLVALALASLYVGFSFIPDQHRVADAAHIAHAVRSEVDRLEGVSVGVPAVRQEVTDAEANWLAAAGFLLESDSLPGFVGWFKTTPGGQGLDGTWEFGSALGGESFRSMPFRLRVKGSSTAFRRMLGQWQSRPRGWGISQMTVLWEDSGTIRATITGALYLRNVD